jgi:hypothetical protein
MVAQQTHPSITEIICSRLLEWKTGIPYSPLDSSFLGLRATVALQDLVGWQAFLEGCPVLGWQETQQRFYTWIGSGGRTGARWLPQVIHKAWDVAWDQWEHRNGILHGVNQGILMQGIDAQIRAQYSQGSAFLPSDVRICSGSHSRTSF